MRLVLICCIALAACTAADGPRVRPVSWAQPVIDSELGNWYRVSADLYRCQQPSASEMAMLAQFGLKSVINLREFHSDADKAAGTGLVVSELKLNAGDLTYPQLVTALKAVLAAPKPTIVHCWHGSDRTGAVVAGWRVAVDGWTPADALDEMVSGGYGHHSLYGNLRTLIGGLDPAKLRAELGLPPR